MSEKDDGGVIMRVIVCVDDNGGMLFNHRRQSRDRVLCERVLQRLMSVIAACI